MSNKIVILFFSHSANTRKIAQCIQEITNGKLVEIQPVEAYPSSYNATVERAKKEIRSGEKCPINAISDDVNSYDVIFIGTPNWCDTMASPIKTFLSENALNRKTILPFYTHGGGGGGSIAKDIAALCAGSNVMECFGVSGSGSASVKSDISEWVRRTLGIIHQS